MRHLILSDGKPSNHDGEPGDYALDAQNQVLYSKSGDGWDDGTPIGGDSNFSGAYEDLSDKPDLGTAAALDAGTEPNDLVQVGEDGKVPSSVLPDVPSSGPQIAAGVSEVALSTFTDGVPDTTHGQGTLVVKYSDFGLPNFPDKYQAVTATAWMRDSGRAGPIRTGEIRTYDDGSGFELDLTYHPSNRNSYNIDGPITSDADGLFSGVSLAFNPPFSANHGDVQMFFTAYALGETALALLIDISATVIASDHVTVSGVVRSSDGSPYHGSFTIWVHAYEDLSNLDGSTSDSTAIVHWQATEYAPPVPHGGSSAPDAPPPSPPTYTAIVSGAGHSFVNGTYEWQALNLGKDSFIDVDSSCRIIWTGSAWEIRDDGHVTIYQSTDDVLEPWLVTTWVPTDSGYDPVPTVTEG